MNAIDLNEMQIVEGGITCDSATAVLAYLYAIESPQYDAIYFGGNSLMCYEGDGSYVNYWNR